LLDHQSDISLMRVLNEGTQLADRYTLIRPLGAGGMAEIWLASDRRADTPVALKFLSAEFVASQAHKDLLHKEWRISANLMHAHIVRAFEFHDEPEGAFFSQQYLGGVDLGVLCGQSPDDILRPIGLIADALRYAHAKGVVHRDLKASNILVDARGAPYLIDFGVAGLISESTAAAGGSEVNQSPQQRQGEAPQPADDIYALGVLLHELLSGEPPTAVEGASIQPGLADGSAMPSALAALLADMLADDATQRPSAQSVADRLREAGFATASVPARYLAGIAHGSSEIIEPEQSIQPVRRATKPAMGEPSAGGKASGGVPPKILYGALGAALVLFLIVIYGLPALVGVDSDEPVVEVVPDVPSVELDATVEDVTEYPQAIRAAPDEGIAAAFSENVSGGFDSDGARVKAATDEALGDLLSRLERLRYRAVDRWGGQPYLDAVDIYAEGDAAYLSRNYALAGDRYRRATETLDPLFDRIDEVFSETLAAAKEAFAAVDPAESVRLFDLAVAITPGHREAEAGLARALSLASVLKLTIQG
jgi:hypothetical protein